MSENEKYGTETEENPKIDLPLDTNEVLEKLQFLVDKTEKIENSQNEFAERLQSIEESVSKNSILLNVRFFFSKKYLTEYINFLSKELKSEKRFVLKHVLENVNKFEEDEDNLSEWEDHYNVKWRMNVKRQNNHLECFIRCEPIAPADKWSIRTKLECKVVGRNQKQAIKSGTCCYESTSGHGFDKLLELDEMKGYYLVDGKLQVEAEVTIIEIAGFGKKKTRLFDESKKDVSDVLLLVQDTKFYVSKTYFAAQSSFFKTLFLGNFSESGQSEVALSGIDPEDFQSFLEVLYGESAIDDSTVEGILHIGDMYATPMVVRKCEEFLLKKSKKPAEKLLEMVARYNLENLKEKCMSEIKTVADIRDVLPPNIKDMDHLILAEILEKALSFH